MSRKQLKIDLLSYFGKAVWGASCRASSFLFRFNSLDFGPLALFAHLDPVILKVNLNFQLDLQAGFPRGVLVYKIIYIAGAGVLADVHNRLTSWNFGGPSRGWTACHRGQCAWMGMGPTPDDLCFLFAERITIWQEDLIVSDRHRCHNGVGSF